MFLGVAMPAQSNYEGQNDTGMWAIIGYSTTNISLLNIFSVGYKRLVCPYMYIDGWLCVVAVSTIQLQDSMSSYGYIYSSP